MLSGDRSRGNNKCERHHQTEFKSSQHKGGERLNSMHPCNVSTVAFEHSMDQL